MLFEIIHWLSTTYRHTQVIFELIQGLSYSVPYLSPQAQAYLLHGPHFSILCFHNSDESWNALVPSDPLAS